MLRSRRRIVTLLVLILLLFFAFTLYLVYFEVFESAKLVDDPNNLRNAVDERFFGRGLFFDRNGDPITERTKQEDGTYARSNIYPNMYAHIVGYNSYQYGKSGLESAYNSALLNLSDDNPISRIRGKVLDEGVGNNVRLTLDNGLQMKAYYALEGHKGAIVGMNPKTGEILCMVSMPGFNVNRIEEDWNILLGMEKESPFLNRATQGRYTPGSVMKPISALSFLNAGISMEYDDTGEETIDGFTYRNYNDEVYGTIGLREALIHSSNTYFANKAMDVPAQELRVVAERMYLTRSLPFDLAVTKSSVLYSESMKRTEKAANTFGQGTTLVTPLAMASAYSAIGNGGKIYAPYVVDAILSPAGNMIKQTAPAILETVGSASAIHEIQRDLKDVMTETNSAALIRGVDVAGKTGTAENDSGKVHAWFCGYAPADDPTIALVVLLEEEGEIAARSASPIAGELFNYWFNER